MKLNLLLAAALALCVTAGFFVRSHPSRPNFEVLPEMARTAAYKAYAANPNFPDGKTLQPPPAGTIPRGFHAVHPVELQPGEAGAVRAGQELTNPYQAGDAGAFARGALVFRTWCLPCHGPTGKGDGPTALRGFPAPPPLDGQKTVALKDGRLFHILTYGQKNMPSYASQVSEDDRWKAILYVRSLQRPAPVAAAASPAPAAPVPPAPPEVRK